MERIERRESLGMKRRTALLSALSGLGVAIVLAACTPAAVKDTSVVTQSPTTIANAAAGTDTCMTCHGDGTVLNEKIQNARDSWMTSGHALGQTASLLDSTGAPIGEEKEGADTYYANGGGCQVCHTKEGFNKKVAGLYTATSSDSTDVISHPSSLTCFTCHKPHTNGNFDLVVPPTKTVTLLSGAVYSKEKGSICASCHMARTASGDGAQYAIDSVKKGLSSSWGPHHGPQADLLLGKAGAQYTGKTYSNGGHTNQSKANCVTCHMTYPDARFGGSANLAGHSFQAVGMVHGAEKANTAGCVSCHDKAKALNVGGSGAMTASGHLRAGMAYYDTGKTTNHYDLMNKLLTALVNPTNGTGLLNTTFQRTDVATLSLTVSTDGRGTLSGIDKMPKFASVTDASASVRFAKALYNYKFIKEDKSFGVHNNVYAEQLLWDSCEDLANLNGIDISTLNIGTRP